MRTNQYSKTRNQAFEPAEKIKYINTSIYFSATLMMLALFVILMLIGSPELLTRAFGIDITHDSFSWGTTEHISAEQAEQKTPMPEEAHIAVIAPVAQDTPAVFDSLEYLKLDYLQYPGLGDIPEEYRKNIDLIILCKENLSNTEIDELKSFLSSGVNVVFGIMPEISLIRENPELKSIMGIEDIVLDQCKIVGCRLIEGFLIGGEGAYDELDITIPYLTLTAGNKPYMFGLPEYIDAKIALSFLRTLRPENSSTEDLTARTADGILFVDLPATIWKHSGGNANVIVFNGDFLRSHDGVGFLVAALSELNDCFAYPVINEQTMMFFNLPYFSNENPETMQSLYSQEGNKFVMNTVMPAIATTLDITGDKMTCFMSSKLDYGDSSAATDMSALNYYIDQIKKKQGELALSGYEMSGRDNIEKLNHDMALIKASGGKVKSFAPQNMKKEQYLKLISPGNVLEDVRTLVMPFKSGGAANFGFEGENVVRLPQTIDGYNHSGRDDLSMRSWQTALAASNVGIDIKKIIYPSGPDDNHIKLHTDWSKYFTTYWKPYKQFDKLTVSQAGERVRRFLTLDYKVEYGDGYVTINVNDDIGEAYFIIRTHGEELALADVSAKEAPPIEIEPGIYLVRIDEKEVKYQLVNKRVLPPGLS